MEKINGLTARFTDTTDGSQDMNQSPTAINFDTENYNFAPVAYGGTKFEMQEIGFYNCSFSCLLSDSGAQSLIYFTLDDVYYYGNLSTYVSGATEKVPFVLETVVYVQTPNSLLKVVGEKFNGGPNYLSKEPIYGNAATQLTITKI